MFDRTKPFVRHLMVPCVYEQGGKYYNAGQVEVTATGAPLDAPTLPPIAPPDPKVKTTVIGKVIPSPSADIPAKELLLTGAQNPYKTKKAAETNLKRRKLDPATHTVVPYKEGYAIEVK